MLNLNSTQTDPIIHQAINSLLGRGLDNGLQDIDMGRFVIPEYSDVDVPVFNRPALSLQVTDSKSTRPISGVTNFDRLTELYQKSNATAPENQLGNFE